MSSGFCLQSPVSALHSGKSDIFGPISCFVVNFLSEHAAPWKFVYEGCRKCLTSRRKGYACHIDAGTAEIYRFSIFLTDGSRGGEPLRATIFNEAAVLLDLSASQFHVLSEEQQEDTIRRSVLSFPRVLVWISNKQGTMTISRLQRAGVCLQPLSSSQPRVIQTEPPRAEKKVTYEDFEDIRRCLAEVYEKLKEREVEKTVVLDEDTGSTSSGVDMSLDFSLLSRKELQTLCKTHKLPANRTNSEMMEALKRRMRGKEVIDK